jgi:hypothetical protein
MKRRQVFSAAAALLVVATAAHAQRGQDRSGHQDQRGQVSRQDQQHQSADDRRAAVPQQRGGGDQGRAEQGRAEQPHVDEARAAQSRADQGRADQARAEQARAEQARAEQARAAEMENQRRGAQLGQQQREQQARQAQQQQIERAQRAEQEAQLAQRERERQANGAFDRDRIGRPGYEYRYNMGGVFRETNQYGVDVLRQAVNQGYQEGYRAGRIDRRDGVPADFQRAFEFENGSFGYAGAYVPLSDYSYYAREGFQRGYDDAYWNRARYGTFLNGNASILSDIVTGILGLTMLR